MSTRRGLQTAKPTEDRLARVWVCSGVWGVECPSCGMIQHTHHGKDRTDVQVCISCKKPIHFERQVH
jgi:hypothetical protein